ADTDSSTDVYPTSMWAPAICQLHSPYSRGGAWCEGLEVAMISRWLKRHLRRGRGTDDMMRGAADAVWRPALPFDSAMRPIAWWRAL
ncbi:MAG TPA: hypothetical protein VMD51_02815, partial [Mycobacterium sp.]|nr:hypothetical protein [Mycobacterium sp.]